MGMILGEMEETLSFTKTIGSVLLESENDVKIYIVMEFNKPLLENKKINSKLNINAKQLLIAKLLGIKVIHQKGILTNDIKPSNIVVGAGNIPVLVDFGISCFVQEAIKNICTEPYNKIIGPCCQESLGTPLYLPPEIMKNVRYPASDLWSLGATVYRIITGTNIWSLDIFQFSNINLVAQVVSKFTQGILPNQLNTGDQQLDTIVNSFLQYDPSFRMNIDQALIILG